MDSAEENDSLWLVCNKPNTKKGLSQVQTHQCTHRDLSLTQI